MLACLCLRVMFTVREFREMIDAHDNHANQKPMQIRQEDQNGRARCCPPTYSAEKCAWVLFKWAITERNAYYCVLKITIGGIPLTFCPLQYHVFWGALSRFPLSPHFFFLRRRLCAWVSLYLWALNTTPHAFTTIILNK